MHKKGGRKNRPKNRPSQSRKPRQQQAPKKPETKTGITRRHLLATLGVVGGGILALRYGIGKYFEDETQDETPEEQEPKEQQTDTAPERTPVVRTPEWMKGIELPSVKFDESEKWSDETVDDYFLPKSVDRKTIEHFNNVFDQLTKELLLKLPNLKSIEERNNLINFYLGQLFDTVLSKNWRRFSLEKCIAMVNRLLIPHGYWLGGDREYGESSNKFVLYKIKEIHPLSIELKGQKAEIPILSLDDKDDILVDPKADSIDFNGAYFHDGQYVVVDKKMIVSTSRIIKEFEGICRKHGLTVSLIGDKEKFRLLLEAGIMHEGMHGVSHRVIGNEPSKKTIKPRNINMGHYVLEGGRYGEIKTIEADELMANGFGALHSGELVSFVLYAIHTTSQSDPNYRFSDFVLLNELLYSPHLNPLSRQQLLQKLQEGGITNNDFVNFMMKIPQKERHCIGERMAKLGIYLTQ